MTKLPSVPHHISARLDDIKRLAEDIKTHKSVVDGKHVYPASLVNVLLTAISTLTPMEEVKVWKCDCGYLCRSTDNCRVPLRQSTPGFRERNRCVPFTVYLQPIEESGTIDDVTKLQESGEEKEQESKSELLAVRKEIVRKIAGIHKEGQGNTGDSCDIPSLVQEYADYSERYKKGFKEPAEEKTNISCEESKGQTNQDESFKKQDEIEEIKLLDCRIDHNGCYVNKRKCSYGAYETALVFNQLTRAINEIRGK